MGQAFTLVSAPFSCDWRVSASFSTGLRSQGNATGWPHPVQAPPLFLVQLHTRVHAPHPQVGRQSHRGLHRGRPAPQGHELAAAPQGRCHLVHNATRRAHNPVLDLRV